MFKIIEGNFKKGQYSDEEYLDNWPMLYILENGKQAYIGESTHVKTRMIQHAIAEEKRIFEKVHFIYSRLFNQSVTFDYESKLIQYIVADELFQVTNKNFGIADKQYYQKKEYDKKFEALWRKLQKQKLVKHSLEEIEKLINSATQIRNKAIIALLYSSGMRVGELVSLKPEDIYMSTMQVYISKGKNHRDRWTILSERALDLLKEYWRSYPVKREYLFVSLDAPHEPLKVSGVEIMLRAVGKTAGIEAHPHTLRHSFASHMIEQGVPIHYVQAMLGHRCLESTQVYIHISNKTVMGIKSPLDHPVKKKRGHKSKRNAGDANES